MRTTVTPSILDRIFTYNRQNIIYSTPLRKKEIIGACSSWAKVTSGVPYDSFLGPLFFLVHVDDSPQEMDESYLNIPRNKAKLMRKVKCVHDHNSLQGHLERSQHWSGAGLVKFRSWRRYRDENEERWPDYLLAGGKLEKSTSEKDLRGKTHLILLNTRTCQKWC